MFTVPNFVGNLLLHHWEFFVDTLLQDQEAFIPRLYFGLQVLSELVFLLPKLFVDTLQTVLTARQK